MMRTFEQLTASQQKEVERQLQLYMTGAHEVIPPGGIKGKAREINFHGHAA